jgi:hypothetical protein
VARRLELGDPVDAAAAAAVYDEEKDGAGTSLDSVWSFLIVVATCRL